MLDKGNIDDVIGCNLEPDGVVQLIGMLKGCKMFETHDRDKGCCLF